MKVGMNLLLWTGNVTEEHYPLLEKIKAWGFDGAELPLFGFDKAQYQAIRKTLDSIGLECTTVTIVPPEANPIDSDSKIRAAAVDRLKQAIDTCQILNCKVMCGPYVSPVGKLVGRGRSADEWKWAVESFQKLAPYAQQAGVMLGLEALNRFETYFVNCMADISRLVDEVNHPNFRLMYDTFHANIEEKSVPEAIRTAGKRIVHVHISENDRSTPGEGQVRWSENFETLKAINYDGWLVIEAFGLALPELAAATCIWRRMFPDEEHVATRGIQFIRQRWSGRS
jgi:D-psicose/D-tagatose/L-ribulose 3-epimerase